MRVFNFWRYLIDFSGSSGDDDRRLMRRCHCPSQIFNKTIVENTLFAFLKAWRTGHSKPVNTIVSTEYY